MNRHLCGGGRNLQERFRLRFERRFRELLAAHHSAAEGFGPAWEATLEEVPLEDEDQGAVYRELIRWASSAELFTSTREEQLLRAWSHTVHEC
jgi:hypothetical protein